MDTSIQFIVIDISYLLSIDIADSVYRIVVLQAKNLKRKIKNHNSKLKTLFLIFSFEL